MTDKIKIDDLEQRLHSIVMQLDEKNRIIEDQSRHIFALELDLEHAVSQLVKLNEIKSRKSYKFYADSLIDANIA